MEKDKELDVGVAWEVVALAVRYFLDADPDQDSPVVANRHFVQSITSLRIDDISQLSGGDGVGLDLYGVWP